MADAGRRRGGVRQRLAREAREATDARAAIEDLNGSSLVTFLVFLYAWGTVSPQMLQRLAMHAHADSCKMGRHASRGAADPCFTDLKLLAEIGPRVLYGFSTTPP